MDLTPKPPPDATVQSPKPRPPSILLSFTNGALKQRHPPPPLRTHYRECLRNHAANLGGHALDGCGEFMPSALASPSDPTSLKCAACGCHRNFHRRDDDDDDEDEFTPTKRHNSHSPPVAAASAPPLAASSPYYPSAPQMLMALSAGISGADADNVPTTPNTNVSTMTGRKRFRTKFSKEQKERMHAFSENLGWKMQKKDEKDVEDFCHEIGVGKAVLKVWMHNNKHTFLKRDSGTSGNIDNNTTVTTTNNTNNHHNNNNDNNTHSVMNGSSSSS